eukprot:1468973-Rhodomonas_salina.2
MVSADMVSGGARLLPRRPGRRLRPRPRRRARWTALDRCDIRQLRCCQEGTEWVEPPAEPPVLTGYKVSSAACLVRAQRWRALT